MNKLTICILRVTEMSTTFEASDGEHIIEGTCGAGTEAQRALQLVIQNAVRLLAAKHSEEMLRRFMGKDEPPGLTRQDVINEMRRARGEA